MEQKRINAVLIVAALALTLPTLLPLTRTAASRLEQQSLEPLSALNSTEA